MTFAHFSIRTYECGGQRYHRPEFDVRFYGPERAGRLNELYTAWGAASSAADSYHYEHEEWNRAADATWNELTRTEAQYNKENEKMNILDAGILKYLSGDMVQNKRIMAFIADVRMEEITQGARRPVLYLKDKRLGIVLNAANARTLAASYGMETDDWRNKAVIIYAEQGRWFGKDGWAIRMAIPAMAEQPVLQEQPAEAMAEI